MRCQHGARCEDGVCRCPTDCPATAASASASALLCANDGRVYPDECHMHKAACDLGLELHRVHSGPCPTTAADLVLAPVDAVDAADAAAAAAAAAANAAGSLDDQSMVTLPNRKCNCNPQGRFLVFFIAKKKEKKTKMRVVNQTETSTARHQVQDVIFFLFFFCFYNIAVESKSGLKIGKQEIK